MYLYIDFHIHVYTYMYTVGPAGAHDRFFMLEYTAVSVYYFFHRDAKIGNCGNCCFFIASCYTYP